MFVWKFASMSRARTKEFQPDKNQQDNGGNGNEKTKKRWEHLRDGEWSTTCRRGKGLHASPRPAPCEESPLDS